MGGILAQVIIPLILSIITTFVLDGLHKFHLGPFWTIFYASIIILILLIPVIYFRFIGATLQSPGKWRIGGTWESKWSYKKGTEFIIVVGKLNIIQWGSFLFGRGSGFSTSQNAPLSSFEYKFNGVVNGEGLIEGKWQNINTGGVYYGVCQLRVSRSCNSVAGFWIGSARNELNCGEWDWFRPQPRAAQSTLINDVRRFPKT